MNWEESFDFTNWRNHPTQRKYVVFFFSSVQQGNYFEQLLTEHQIWFERHLDPDDEKRPIWFAVERKDMPSVKGLNHLAIGRYRNKFIPVAGMRWFVLGVSAIIVALMIVGMIKGNP